MASSSKKRTTMAKITRENKLRERRMDKQARKDARKLAAADPSPEDIGAVVLATQDEDPASDAGTHAPAGDADA